MAYNLLIVDDSSTTRAVISKVVKLAGLPINQLFEAGNGREALEVLATEWIDLVFADINMPVMNGIELVEEMERSDLLKSVPVVIVSTEGSKRIGHLKEKGVRAYIRKPFTPEQIKEVVEGILTIP